MTDYFETPEELDLKEIQLDELIVVLGSCIFSGTNVEDIDEVLLIRLTELIKAEQVIRENDMRPPKEDDTIH